MGFGKTLREAREAKGYTVAQLAETTHIMSRAIEGLEAEDFSAIAAPIYGRGFVKLCCQALGLDPGPMIEEFMAIYTGEKPAEAAAPVSDPPAASVATAPEKPAEDDPAEAGLFELTADHVPDAGPAVSRYAPPRPEDPETRRIPFALPALPWRLVVLILGAVAVGWALVAGCTALCRALGGDDDAAAPSETAQTPGGGDRAAPAAPRTPKPVSPLYID